MLIQVYTNVSKEGKRFAFEQIRQKSLAKRMQFGSRADHIIRSTLHKALTWQRRTLKARFDQLYKNSKIKKGKDLRLKAAFYKATNKFYRDAFNKWKSAAALLEVIRFNNEEGPVRMETNLIKQDIANLRRFIKDRGLYTERELNDLLAYDDACYRGIAEKALVCRAIAMAKVTADSTRNKTTSSASSSQGAGAAPQQLAMFGNAGGGDTPAFALANML